MSTIFLDPVAMDATAGAVGEHALEIEDLAVTLEAACSANVPLHLVGWLAEELRDIVVGTRLAALLYTAAALDTALRAQQIQADQSLVAAQPELATAPVDLATALGMGAVVGGSGPAFVNDFPGLGESVVGGTGPAFVNDFPGLGESVVGGGLPLGISDVPVLGPTVVGGSWSSSRLGVVDPGIFTATIMSLLSQTPSAPDGLSFVSPGNYEDRHGGRGGLGESYRDPVTGEQRF